MLNLFKLCCFLCCITIIWSHSVLTNFKHDFLPSNWQEILLEKSAPNQVLLLMRNYFLHKNKHSEYDWSKYKLDLENDSSEFGMKTFMNKFDDKYSTFFSKETMIKRWQVGKGVVKGNGIEVQRKLHLNKVKLSVNRKSAVLLPLFICASVAVKRITSKYVCNVLFGLSVLELARHVVPAVYPLEVVNIQQGDETSKLQIGDEVVAINGQTWSLPMLFPKCCFPRSNVSVLIRRHNIDDDNNLSGPESKLTSLPQLLKVEISEDYLHSPSIATSLREARANKGLNDATDNHIKLIGCVSIKEFTDLTYLEVSQGLSLMQQEALNKSGKPLDGLIIDLRKNSGGSVTSALDIAALFVKKGCPLLCINLSSTTQRVESLNHNADVCTPLLVLCDSQTASSSEILIQALVDNQRCHTMGCKTFGKNIAQALVPLCDGSGLAFTVAEFCSPLGNDMSSGHTPHTIVKDSQTGFSMSKIGFDDETKEWSLSE